MPGSKDLLEIQFTPDTAPLHIGPCGPDDEATLQASDPRCSATRRRWLRAAPEGIETWGAWTPDGRLVHHLSLLPQRALEDGQEVTWSLVVDAISDASLPRDLRRRSGFVALARALCEARGGPDADTLHYGLPPRSHYRVGRAELDFDAGRNQNLLTLQVEDAPAAASMDLRVDELPTFPEELDAFARVACEGRAAHVVRDARLLNWRHVAAPHGPASLCLVRDPDGALRGYGVHRSTELLGQRTGVLVDQLVRPGDDEALSVLVAWAAERSRTDTAAEGRLATLVSDTSPEWLALQRMGLRVRPTRRFLTARSYLKRHDLRWLYWNGHFTWGDLEASFA